MTFSDDEKKRARNTITGLYEHHYELKDMMTYIMKNLEIHKDDMNDLLKPYFDYKPEYKD